MKSLIVPVAIALSALALPACGRNSNERSEPDANLAGRDNAAMAAIRTGLRMAKLMKGNRAKRNPGKAGAFPGKL